MGNKVLVYTKFERFWHWTQAILIMILAFTGLEIHGTWSVLGFKNAVDVHNFCAWAWTILLVLIFFWLFITGEWKQFLPTTNGLGATLRFYMIGIFKGEKHPHKKTEVSKLNPVQRLAYLQLKLVFLPVQLVSGFLYYFYHQWHEVGLSGRIDTVAYIHTFFAYAIIMFVIIHVYMTTTGHTPLAHIKAMLTGHEDLEEH